MINSSIKREPKSRKILMSVSKKTQKNALTTQRLKFDCTHCTDRSCTTALFSIIFEREEHQNLARLTEPYYQRNFPHL